VPTRDYVLNNALETAKLYEVVWQKAEEQDCGLTDEDKADYDAQVAELKSQLEASGTSGDAESEYLRWLAFIGISGETFDMVNQTPYIYGHLKDIAFRRRRPHRRGHGPWLEDNGVVRAKHILIAAEAHQGTRRQRHRRRHGRRPGQGQRDPGPAQGRRGHRRAVRRAHGRQQRPM
jgi:hypothetical protein